MTAAILAAIADIALTLWLVHKMDHAPLHDEATER